MYTFLSLKKKRFTNDNDDGNDTHTIFVAHPKGYRLHEFHEIVGYWQSANGSLLARVLFNKKKISL